MNVSSQGLCSAGMYKQENIDWEQGSDITAENHTDETFARIGVDTSGVNTCMDVDILLKVHKWMKECFKVSKDSFMVED